MMIEKWATLALVALVGIAAAIAVFLVALRFVGNVLIGMREAERDYRLRVGRCLSCGYRLRGNHSGRCPECGKAIRTTAGAAGRPTEQRLTASEGLDAMPIARAVRLMNAEDAVAVAAVTREWTNVARAIELTVTAFERGGRLIYVGAGTSGRLGVLDASECPPTFRTDPEMVQAIIAGGPGAVFRAVEGAEDDAAAGGLSIDERNVEPSDVVLGIAASGTTPFVWGALQRARERGAKTVLLACVPAVGGEPAVDVQIRPVTGPEVLTGSTRLKAGTATKLVLNQITTIAMARLGKTYGNLMVDLSASNAKLRDRAMRMLCQLTGLAPGPAVELLDRAGGRVKVAVVMSRRGVTASEADDLLAVAGGRLRDVIGW